MLDEQKLNLEVRRLLKRFGVGAQREIEKAVGEAVRTGALSGDEGLEAKVTLDIPSIGLRFQVEDTIQLS
ncbi:MAG: DUF6494 family protein [Gemmatimonadota bacterium]